MLCQKCQSRSICQGSCPELELHLKELEKPQRELPIANPQFGKILWPSSVHLTKKEKEILTLLAKDLSRDDICQVLDVSRQALRFHLFNLKKKMIEY